MITWMNLRGLHRVKKARQIPQILLFYAELPLDSGKQEWVWEGERKLRLVIDYKTAVEYGE